jgi:hypothetical protein
VPQIIDALGAFVQDCDSAVELGPASRANAYPVGSALPARHGGAVPRTPRAILRKFVDERFVFTPNPAGGHLFKGEGDLGLVLRMAFPTGRESDACGTGRSTARSCLLRSAPSNLLSDSYQGSASFRWAVERRAVLFELNGLCADEHWHESFAERLAKLPKDKRVEMGHLAEIERVTFAEMYSRLHDESRDLSSAELPLREAWDAAIQRSGADQYWPVMREFSAVLREQPAFPEQARRWRRTKSPYSRPQMGSCLVGCSTGHGANVLARPLTPPSRSIGCRAPAARAETS